MFFLSGSTCPQASQICWDTCTAWRKFFEWNCYSTPSRSLIHTNWDMSYMSWKSTSTPTRCPRMKVMLLKKLLKKLLLKNYNFFCWLKYFSNLPEFEQRELVCSLHAPNCISVSNLIRTIFWRTFGTTPCLNLISFPIRQSNDWFCTLLHLFSPTLLWFRFPIELRSIRPSTHLFNPQQPSKYLKHMLIQHLQV